MLVLLYISDRRLALLLGLSILSGMAGLLLLAL